MKIKIAYLPEESAEVEDILYILMQKRPDAKIKKKDLNTFVEVFINWSG